MTDVMGMRRACPGDKLIERIQRARVRCVEAQDRASKRLRALFPEVGDNYRSIVMEPWRFESYKDFYDDYVRPLDDRLVKIDAMLFVLDAAETYWLDRAEIDEIVALEQETPLP